MTAVLGGRGRSTAEAEMLILWCGLVANRGLPRVALSTMLGESGKSGSGSKGGSKTLGVALSKLGPLRS